MSDRYRDRLGFRTCGDSALLVECPDIDTVTTLHHRLGRTRPHGVIDVIPAARSVFVTFDPALVGRGALEQRIRDLPPSERDTTENTVVRIPVTYDGADMEHVTRLTGLTVEELIAAHTGTLWDVAFCGFVPGFAYLTGGDSRLDVPRRAEPRATVPSGSVALAGGFAAVYPRPSPGGWQIIGHTDVSLWDVTADPPAMLSPGVSVRFVTRSRP